MDARGSLTLQMMTIESLHKKEPSEGNPDSRPAVKSQIMVFPDWETATDGIGR